MTYTTHGLMIGVDFQDARESMDAHNITVQLDDPPAWWTESDSRIACLVCGDIVHMHESVTFPAAGGPEDAIECVGGDGEWRELGG